MLLWVLRIKKSLVVSHYQTRRNTITTFANENEDISRSRILKRDDRWYTSNPVVETCSKPFKFLASHFVSTKYSSWDPIVSMVTLIARPKTLLLLPFFTLSIPNAPLHSLTLSLPFRSFPTRCESKHVSTNVPPFFIELFNVLWKFVNVSEDLKK